MKKHRRGLTLTIEGAQKAVQRGDQRRYGRALRNGVGHNPEQIGVFKHNRRASESSIAEAKSRNDLVDGSYESFSVPEKAN